MPPETGRQTVPIACSLTESELQKRREELLHRVFGEVQETRTLEDGYAFRFKPDDSILGELMQVVRLERQCCRFLRFHLSVESDGGPVWLELTGPAGTKAFLEDALGPRLKSMDQGR